MTSRTGYNAAPHVESITPLLHRAPSLVAVRSMQAPTIEVNAQDIAEGTDLHFLMGAAVPGFNLQQSDACRVVKTEAGPADVATVYDEVADRPTSGKGEGRGGGGGDRVVTRYVAVRGPGA